MKLEKEPQAANILIAEDNPADVILIREALSSTGQHYALEVRSDGEQVLLFLNEIEEIGAEYPDLVLLDLNLPRRNGQELLQYIRQNSKCRDVPVVIVTSSDSPRDRAAAAKLGATYYFCKPCDFYEFMKLGPIVEDLLLQARSLVGLRNDHALPDRFAGDDTGAGSIKTVR